MKAWYRVASLAIVSLSLIFEGCSYDVTGGSQDQIENSNDAVDAAPLIKSDGEPCDNHSECQSGTCIPTLPSEISPRGVCWGEGYQGCVQILIFDTWAESACTDLGMTVALCAPIATQEIAERCKKPYGEVGGEYPYDYMCCETTLFE